MQCYPYLDDLALLCAGRLQRLDHQPGALVVLNVGADFANDLRLAVAVEVVVLNLCIAPPNVRRSDPRYGKTNPSSTSLINGHRLYSTTPLKCSPYAHGFLRGFPSHRYSCNALGNYGITCQDDASECDRRPVLECRNT